MPGACALGELGIGVADLEAAARFYERAFGLVRVGEGGVGPRAARALWDVAGPLRALRLARPDVPAGPRLRLVGVPGGAAARPGRDLLAPGPLGIGFTTRDVAAVHERVAAAGAAFLSPPLRLTPDAAGPAGPRRYEAFGQAADGEFVVLIERVGAATPYGTISALGTSEPLHSSHVVSDLEACSRFMVEALGHRVLIRERAAGPLFEELMGTPPGTAFRFEMLERPGAAAGRIIFIEYEAAGGRAAAGAPAEPPARGLHALRYDCDDLEAAARRVAPAGGTILRGPLEVDEELLGSGRGLAVRPPFGTLIELWQPR